MEIEFVLSILRRRSLTELTAQFLLGNSLQMRLVPHPFCWQTSLIDALSSYVKQMFINKLLRHNDVTLFSPLCFLYRWVAFNYFGPLQIIENILHEIRTPYTELIIFQRALFTLNVHYSWKT